MIKTYRLTDRFSIDRAFSQGRDMELKGTEKVKGVLACPTISPNAKKMMEKWGFEWKRVQPPMRLQTHKNQSKLTDL